jgi:hypothetical protein
MSPKARADQQAPDIQGFNRFPSPFASRFGVTLRKRPILSWVYFRPESVLTLPAWYVCSTTSPRKRGTAAPRRTSTLRLEFTPRSILFPSGLAPFSTCIFKCLYNLAYGFTSCLNRFCNLPRTICSYTHTDRSISNSSVGFC